MEEEEDASRGEEVEVEEVVGRTADGGDEDPLVVAVAAVAMLHLLEEEVVVVVDVEVHDHGGGGNDEDEGSGGDEADVNANGLDHFPLDVAAEAVEHYYQSTSLLGCTRLSRSNCSPME